MNVWTVKVVTKIRNVCDCFVRPVLIKSNNRIVYLKDCLKRYIERMGVRWGRGGGFMSSIYILI